MTIFRLLIRRDMLYIILTIIGLITLAPCFSNILSFLFKPISWIIIFISYPILSIYEKIRTKKREKYKSLEQAATSYTSKLNAQKKLQAIDKAEQKIPNLLMVLCEIGRAHV